MYFPSFIENKKNLKLQNKDGNDELDEDEFVDIITTKFMASLMGDHQVKMLEQVSDLLRIDLD